MEILTKTIQGVKCNVIFNGASYIFQYPFFGVIAVADRAYDMERDNKAFFTISVGNAYCSAGTLTDAVVVSAVKSVINKNECKYVHKDVSYGIGRCALHNGYIEVDFKMR